ncbi:hypothetical protein KBY65_13210 [Cyanobium sp. Alchichica 3B3-8F6]|uniref:hypothetical protein n=1 Tax=Cyanobium sp. Alchichica 3B3-8F6 TaxID=2823696 RepID=UPI0020CB9250|nr:hypothetical protein [Cyanobium sp. Alchichica 3B3-8F6]MCP9883413.1 hypothetical protein [Cyanobium sp. Alchichica 3B3-8F6]
MHKEEIDLLELNKEILAAPSKSANHPQIQLLELEDPELDFLCPLAKAIYLIETNRDEQVDPPGGTVQLHRG